MSRAWGFSRIIGEATEYWHFLVLGCLWDLPAIRAKAELTLAELAKDSSMFEPLARELSNCSSGQQGGSLGQLGRGETVPEFEQALFNWAYIGIYPQLWRTVAPGACLI